MSGLSSTVTFLSTDIEGSTGLLQRLGDSHYADVLGVHWQLLRAAIREGDGREISSKGDGVLVEFRNATDAVKAAVAAQLAITKYPWPDGVVLRVRMGLHTGERVDLAGDPVGLSINRAARICEAGHGGQILVSGTTWSLVENDLPNEVSARDLRSHRLKDLKQPERIFQLVHPQLPTEFPPLRSLSARPNNLPIHLTSFIGREQEVAKIIRLLPSTCLLTLTGSGGCGKTRLAVKVAVTLLDKFDDGVWFVDLSALSDPALVPQAVASALSIPEQPARALAEVLVSYLRSKSLLLVLDNCEHLVVSCARLAEELLRICPSLRILATSREPLTIGGEVTFRVPSLSLPDPEAAVSAEHLMRYEAVQLFVARVKAVQHEFELTSRNALAVARICRQLDGIPLAIELAAARVAVLTVEQIAERLDDRFRLLTGGSRTALPRQKTLRATMDWSYALLSEKERVLLRRLSVFAGGWTLEAAEAVCAQEGIENQEVLDLLGRLVDKSLVLVDELDSEPRYRQLETVREYGQLHLRESGEEAPVRTWHLGWYLAFAEQAEQALAGPEQTMWFDKIEMELDNVRTTLEWSLQSGRTPAALRLATALREFWFVRGYMAEGRRWLEAALAGPGDVPPALRAKALRTTGSLAVFGQGDYTAGRAFHEASLRLWRGLKDSQNIAQSLHDLGSVAAGLGEHQHARRLYEESLALRQEAGDRVGSAVSLNNLGRVAYREGDYDAAAALLEESLAIYRGAGDKQGIGMVLTNLGLVACRRGEHARALSLLQRGLALHRELGDTRRIAFSLEAFGALAAALQQSEAAARLYGAAEGLRGALGSPLPPADRPDYERGVAAARAGLGQEAPFAAVWAAGRVMTIDEAMSEAEALAALLAGEPNHR